MPKKSNKKRYWEKDKGYDKLMTTFKENGGKMAAYVGFLQSSSKYPGKDGMTVAQVAAINEYGSDDGRVPERSFFRTTRKEWDKKGAKMAKKLLERILEGRMTKKTALGVLAEAFVIAVKNKIMSNVPPPNAAATIAMKGSSHTLIDTGRMRDSLAWEIKKGGKSV